MRADDIVHWTNRAKVYQQNRPNPVTLFNREGTNDNVLYQATIPTDHQFSSRKFPSRGGEYVQQIDKQSPHEISRGKHVPTHYVHTTYHIYRYEFQIRRNVFRFIQNICLQSSPGHRHEYLS